MGLGRCPLLCHVLPGEGGLYVHESDRGRLFGRGIAMLTRPRVLLILGS